MNEDYPLSFPIVRPEVSRFAGLMEAQLIKHDDKLGWKNEYIKFLFDRLIEEANELFELLKSPAVVDPVRIGEEAADVANFAMMIADVCGALKEDVDADR